MSASIAKVLLVDDEPDIRKIGEMSLRRVGGWDVVLASSGREAVALAASARPDVILLDVMMPDMDGPTALAELRARPATAEVPVIFITAKVQKHEIDRYLSLGVAGVIRKPFDPLGLPADVLRIVEGRAREA